MKNYVRKALAAAMSVIPFGMMASDNVFETYRFQPEENKAVARISKLRIEFPEGDANISIDRAKTGMITMSGAGTTYRCREFTGFGSSWAMEFSPNQDGAAVVISEKGEYTLSIPEGTFRYDSEGYASSSISAKFIVSDDIDFAWTSYPTSGSEKALPEYGDIDISITFPDASTVSTDPRAEGATHSVTLGGMTLNRLDNLSDGEGYRLTASSNALRLQVSKSLVKEASEITFTASPGAFTVDGIKSPAIEYKVTYIPPKSYSVEFSPASGSTVASLKEVYVVFPEASKIEKKSIFWDNDATLTPQGGAAIQSEKTEATVFDGHPAIKASFSGTIADGTYEFAIPAGYILLDGTNTSPEVKAVFKVDASYVPGAAMVPPYLNTFDSPADAEAFVIIDGNKDGRTWEWAESYYPEGTLTQEMRVWEYDGKDDWLISPAVKLEAGNVYRIALDARPYGFWSEDFEVLAGRDTTPASMTTTVIPAIHMRDGAKGEGRYFGYLSPEENGEYHIAIHANIKKAGFYLFIDNFEISAAMDRRLPDEVADLKVVTDSHNSKKASITFKAPSTDLGGGRLAKLDRIEVYRDGELIKTFGTPEPGAEMSLIDFVDKSDDYVYIVKVYNEVGEGKGVVRTVYVGVKKASFPTNVRAKETENIGEVLITWDAPATDVDGNPINPEQITYYIVKLENDIQTQIARYVKGNSFTYRAIDADKEQQFFTFGVFAETDGGISNGSQTRLVALGKPYTLPYRESFDTRSLSLIGVTTIAGSAQWSIYGEREGGVPAYDTDDSYAGMEGPAAGDSGILFTGKLDLTSALNPQLSFYVYNFGREAESPYSNRLKIMMDAGLDFQLCKELDLSTLGDETGWVKQSVDLSGFKGKVAQLGFVATTASEDYPFTFIDNIEVEDKQSGVSGIVLNGSSVSVSGGRLTVDNPGREHTIVASVDGKVIYSGRGEVVEMDLTSGVYIVRVGEKSVKAAVK